MTVRPPIAPPSAKGQDAKVDIVVWAAVTVLDQNVRVSRALHRYACRTGRRPVSALA